MNIKNLIDKLSQEHVLTKEEFIFIIENINDEDLKYLNKKASSIRDKHYGNRVFLRGLIEFSNYCKNDCYYCGIRKSNKNVERYRLSLDEILECAEIGHSLGYNTYVLQGGEDGYFNDDRIVEIIKAIKQKYPNCAITLSIGEKSYDSYKKFYDAGADRYLLRHETANEEHYNKLHPENLKLSNRIQCLHNLKDIGYQIGAGFMVGSPYQTLETIAEDLLFLHELQPHMVGIGPFIPHCDTKFKDEPSGDVRTTTILLSLIRLILPTCLLPATTALGTIDPMGREKGLNAGANVIMPNLSPTSTRKKYSLYDNKVGTDDEAIKHKADMENRIINAGYVLDNSRGDNICWNRK